MGYQCNLGLHDLRKNALVGKVLWLAKKVRLARAAGAMLVSPALKRGDLGAKIASQPRRGDAR